MSSIPLLLGLVLIALWLLGAVLNVGPWINLLVVFGIGFIVLDLLLRLVLRRL